MNIKAIKLRVADTIPLMRTQHLKKFEAGRYLFSLLFLCVVLHDVTWWYSSDGIIVLYMKLSNTHSKGS